MFTNPFRKRGRPPEQLPVGGYQSRQSNQEDQTSVHQPLISLDTPKQLPLAPVREFGQRANAGFESEAQLEITDRRSIQQHHNPMEIDPRQVMSPNQATRNENQRPDVLNVPDLPFTQSQRNEILSEASSQIQRELCGPEGVAGRSPLGYDVVV